MVAKSSAEWWAIRDELLVSWNSINEMMKDTCLDDWEIMANVLDLLHVAKSVVYRRYIQVRHAEQEERELDKCTERAINELQVQEMSD